MKRKANFIFVLSAIITTAFCVLSMIILGAYLYFHRARIETNFPLNEAKIYDADKDYFLSSYQFSPQKQKLFAVLANDSDKVTIKVVEIDTKTGTNEVVQTIKLPHKVAKSYASEKMYFNPKIHLTDNEDILLISGHWQSGSIIKIDLSNNTYEIYDYLTVRTFNDKFDTNDESEISSIQQIKEKYDVREVYPKLSVTDKGYTSIVLAENSTEKIAFDFEGKAEKLMPTLLASYYNHEYIEARNVDIYYDEGYRDDLLINYSKDNEYSKNYHSRDYSGRCIEVPMDEKGDCRIKVKYYSKEILLLHQDGYIWDQAYDPFIDPWGNLIFMIEGSIYKIKPE